MKRDLKPSLAEHAALQTLRDSNDRLQRELLREKTRTQRFHEVIREATIDALSGLSLPPVKAPKKVKYRAADEEKALVVLSDLQLAKVTPTYNSAVAAERVDRFARKVSLLTGIARHAHPVREARVYLLGDIVEGELIFPHQPFQIDASLIAQIKNGAEIVTNFVRTLLADFETVHVTGVIGNHGQLQGGKYSKHNPETNMDRMLYILAQEMLRGEPRCSWTIPWEKNERSWYAVDYPFGPAEAPEERPPGDRTHGFLLMHGDQIPGSASHSVATIARHIYGYASGAVPEPFDYCLYGHWHNPRSFRFNKFRAWCNGSVESSNTYAAEKLAAVGHPEQWLLFCHPRQGVTAEYLCDLSED
jgi:hypothetical protein